jgi:hypothetical protein
MRARPGLWEPWVGNDPGPPSPPRFRGCWGSMGNSSHNLQIALSVNPGKCLKSKELVDV